MAPKPLRFAFTLPPVTDAGTALTCSGWRLWTRHEDTYITAKSFGQVWKVSLHADVAWRLAVTQEHLRTAQPLWPVDEDRAPWKFQPPPFVDGERLAFAVGVARGALRPETLDSRETHIEASERWDRATIAYVRMTEPGRELNTDPERVVGGPLPLTSGRQVWLTAAQEATRPALPHPPPAAGLVKVLTPVADGVAAPGLLVVGLN